MPTTPIVETSFFLIWVTSPATFAPRYLRSVESICWHHPDAAVTVLSNTLPPRFFLDLGLHQVSVERYDLGMLTRGTPAEAWYDRRPLYNRSSYFSNHLADLLRLLTLFHRGGTYVDTDVIFTSALRRPTHCRGAVGVESGDPDALPSSETVPATAILCNAVMSFEAGSSFLARAISTFVNEYVPLTPGLSMMELYAKGEWGAMGPLLLTRLLLRADAAVWGSGQGGAESAGGGGGTVARTGAAATETCILGRDAFYPIAPGGDAIAHFGPWEEARDAPVLERILGRDALGGSSSLKRGGGETVVAVHYWNALTRSSPLICGSLMHRLFESGCAVGQELGAAGCVTELPCILPA